jgi:hypothetical protein
MKTDWQIWQNFLRKAMAQKRTDDDDGDDILGRRRENKIF